MAIKVGSLLIDVAANVARISNDLETINKRVGKFQKDVETKMAKVSKTLTTAFASGAAVAVLRRTADAVWDMVDSTTKAADEMGDFAKGVGITTEELSGLEYAAKLTGASIQQVRTGLVIMSKNLAEAADGTGEAKDSLGYLNIQAEKFMSLSMHEQFSQLADAISKVENSTKRIELARSFFGRGGAAMLTMMSDGADGLQRFAAAAEQTGAIVTKEFAGMSDEFQDAMVEMKEAGDGLKRDLTASLLPSFLKVVERITEAAKDLRENGLAGIELDFGWMGKINPAIAAIENYFEAFKTGYGIIRDVKKEIEDLFDVNIRQGFEGIKERAYGKRGGFEPLTPYEYMQPAFVGPPKPATERPGYTPHVDPEKAAKAAAAAGKAAETAMQKYVAINDELTERVLALTATEYDVRREKAKQWLRDSEAVYTAQKRNVSDLRAWYDLEMAEIAKAERTAMVDATASAYDEILQDTHLSVDQLEQVWQRYTSTRLMQISLEADALKKTGMAQKDIDLAIVAKTDELMARLPELRKALDQFKDFETTEPTKGSDAWMNLRMKELRQGGATDRELRKAERDMNLQYSEERGIGAFGGMKIGVQNFTDTLGTEAERWATITETAANSISSNMTDAFAGMIDGTKSVGEAFEQMATQIISDIVRITIQKMVSEKIVGGIFSAFGHSGGMVQSWGIQKMHEGGTVAADAVSPVFTMPTFGHAGGVSKPWGVEKLHGGGLLPDEIPAILQAGEAVIPKNVVRQFPTSFWKDLISMHDGGVIGPIDTKKGGPSSAPSISVNVVNQSGVQMAAQQGEIRWDGRQYVADVYLDLYQNSRGFRQATQRR